MHGSIIHSAVFPVNTGRAVITVQIVGRVDLLRFRLIRCTTVVVHYVRGLTPMFAMMTSSGTRSPMLRCRATCAAARQCSLDFGLGRMRARYYLAYDAIARYFGRSTRLWMLLLMPMLAWAVRVRALMLIRMLMLLLYVWRGHLWRGVWRVDFLWTVDHFV